MLPSPPDHVAISDLFARYCLTLDRDDYDSWLALYLPDAMYEVFGRTFRGHDGLRKMVTTAPGGLHLGGPPVIEMIDPTHAHVVRNLLFVAHDGESRRAVYDDDVVRTAPGWRIAHTRCEFLGQ